MRSSLECTAPMRRRFARWREERPELGANSLHPELPYIAAEVVWAARMEMARSVEDVLARRTRALFLNARAAHADGASRWQRLLAAELGRDDERGWRRRSKEFRELAKQYMV